MAGPVDISYEENNYLVSDQPAPCECTKVWVTASGRHASRMPGSASSLKKRPDAFGGPTRPMASSFVMPVACTPAAQAYECAHTVRTEECHCSCSSVCRLRRPYRQCLYRRARCSQTLWAACITW